MPGECPGRLKTYPPHHATSTSSQARSMQVRQAPTAHFPLGSCTISSQTFAQHSTHLIMQDVAVAGATGCQANPHDDCKLPAVNVGTPTKCQPWGRSPFQECNLVKAWTVAHVTNAVPHVLVSLLSKAGQMKCPPLEQSPRQHHYCNSKTIKGPTFHKSKSAHTTVSSLREA